MANVTSKFTLTSSIFFPNAKILYFGHGIIKKQKWKLDNTVSKDIKRHF